MSDNLVYLCGQITGSTYEEARYGWRAQVVHACEDMPIRFLSPMRAKDHLAGDPGISPMGSDHVLSRENAITTRDRLDVMRSTLIFCNLLGTTDKSIGSMIEFGWADAFRKPVICCMEDDNIHRHVMVDSIIGWHCSTLEQGIFVLRSILTECI
jgi:nucleoside 2-deoxyribosyltransferase